MLSTAALGMVMDVPNVDVVVNIEFLIPGGNSSRIL